MRGRIGHGRAHRQARRRRTRWWLPCAGLLAAHAPLVAQAPEAGSVPRVFLALEGTWDGSGMLLQRPATFTMAWSVEPGGFVSLSFANRWVDASSVVTPVLAAHATYLVRGDSAVGVWLDDRPEQLTLRAILTDSSVVTDWTAETEQGRTEYVIRSPGVAVVRDFVVVDGVRRPFGEASYRRTRDPGR